VTLEVSPNVFHVLSRSIPDIAENIAKGHIFHTEAQQLAEEFVLGDGTDTLGLARLRINDRFGLGHNDVFGSELKNRVTRSWLMSPSVNAEALVAVNRENELRITLE
jgi:hypothetical protein